MNIAHLVTLAAITLLLAGCDKQGHLQAPVAATIEAGNVALCPLWMPLATAALAEVAPPFAALLAGSSGCSLETEAVDALLKELMASAPSPAAGVASSAMTASSPGRVTILSRRGGTVREVMQVPATMAPTCQAAQDRIDSRGGS